MKGVALAKSITARGAVSKKAADTGGRMAKVRSLVPTVHGHWIASYSGLASYRVSRGGAQVDRGGVQLY